MASARVRKVLAGVVKLAYTTTENAGMSPTHCGALRVAPAGCACADCIQLRNRALVFHDQLHVVVRRLQSIMQVV